MVIVKVGKKEMFEFFPIAKKWIKKISKMMPGEFRKKDIEYFFTFTWPSEAATSGYLLNLTFEERIVTEIEMLSINAMIKYGDFSVSDSISSGITPESIRKVAEEMTKVKMMVECQITGNEEIRKTIPDLDSNRVDTEAIRKSIGKISEEESEILDLDTILDKIIENGIESLSEREMEFLKRQGR
jgi:hypothetical protein